MAPKVYLVRHAQGQHNATRDYTIDDPVLTEKGIGQCRELSKSFPYHDTIDLVLASPLKRTIETAAYSFGPTLARAEVPFIAVPSAQEVSNSNSDTGSDPEVLKKALPQLLPQGSIDFDISKLDLSLVTEGWNSKTGYWEYDYKTLQKRAADLRNWLFKRPESHVLLVSHGAFLHFLTEDFSNIEDPLLETAYLNCELRQFVFTPESTAEEAHFTETRESRKTRGASIKEDDPHVLEEIRNSIGAEKVV